MTTEAGKTATKQKSAKKAAPRTAKRKPARAAPKKRAAKHRNKHSQLDAAVMVLASLRGKVRSLRAGELIERMAAKGLWKSPGGKTPAATLDAALRRELRKGAKSRIRTAGRGLFAFKAARSAKKKGGAAGA